MEYLAVLILAAFILMAGAGLRWGRRNKLERGIPEKFLAAIRKSDTETVGMVVDRLENYEPDIRSRVLQLLEQEGVVDSYINSLGGNDIEQKKVAARRLAIIGSPRAVMPLTEAIADKNEEVRLLAAGALKRIKDPVGIEPLIRALREPMKWLPARIAEVLVELGRTAVPALLAALDDPDPEFKGYIIEILGEIGDKSSVTKLAEVLRGHNPAVRAKAAAALAAVGGSEAVQALLAVLTDNDKTVRSQAVLGLRRMGDLAAVPGLADAAGDPDRFVRANALDALGKFGETGLAALQQIAGDSGHPEKDRAAAILEKLGVKNKAKVSILYK